MSYQDRKTNFDLHFGARDAREATFSTAEIAASEPQITVPRIIGYTTVMIYDIDVPVPQQPNVTTTLLHYLVVNIRDGDLSTGETLAPYLPPSPSDRTHRYVVWLLAQPHRQVGRPIGERRGFDVESYINQHQLVDQGHFIFSVNPDVPTQESHQQAQDDDYFLPEAKLSETEKAYCRCVLEVAAKQPGKCSMRHAWFAEMDGRTCYNPYAICHKRILSGESVPRDICGAAFDYSKMPLPELTAFLHLHNIPYDASKGRPGLIEAVYKWKETNK